MSRFTLSRVLSLAALAGSAGACSNSGGPSTQSQVSFNVATQPATSGVSATIVGTPETFTDGTNTLIVNGVHLVLREIELHRAGAVSDCVASAGDDCEK